MRTMKRTGWTVLLGICAVYACSSPARDYGNLGSNGGNAGGPAAGGKAGASGGSSRGGANTAGKLGAGGSEIMAGAGGMLPMGGMPSEGGTGGTVSIGGEGGEGGETVVPPNPGRPGSATVVGGFYMRSKHFSLLSTVGESPGGNGVFTSTKYRLHGGVVGTTQP